MTATADLWERRSLFDDDHEAFRASVREFLARRVAGNVEAWEKQGDITWDELLFLPVRSTGETAGQEPGWRVEHRYRAVLEVRDGSPVTEVALRYGVSRQTVYTWRDRFDRTMNT